MYDKQVQEICDNNPNMYIPWWLMASYLYYICNRNILSDVMFDKMSKEMLSKWDIIEHRHKHLITTEMLEAGSGYNLKDEQYPLMCKHSAWKIATEGISAKYIS